MLQRSDSLTEFSASLVHATVHASVSETAAIVKVILNENAIAEQSSSCKMSRFL